MWDKADRTIDQRSAVAVLKIEQNCMLRTLLRCSVAAVASIALAAAFMAAPEEFTQLRSQQPPIDSGISFDRKHYGIVAPHFDAHISNMKRIAVECLRCGHCSSIPEERLRTFGLSPDAPIAKFIRRLTCIECGGHSVRAYRYDLQDAG